jgi:hypothetical protein
MKSASSQYTPFEVMVKPAVSVRRRSASPAALYRANASPRRRSTALAGQSCFQSAAACQTLRRAFHGALPFRSRARLRSGDVRAELDRRKKYESIFVKEGVIEIDSSGNIREHLKYARAVEEIRAKAAALGYGALSQSVPITDVRGGYVGRFGGHDIYVSV